MLHLAYELFGRYLSSENFVTIGAVVLTVALVHSWACGPALLAREERLEAQQRRAHEKSESVRVTAGLGELGGRVVLIAVRT